jgi:hypothetical protein
MASGIDEEQLFAIWVNGNGLRPVEKGRPCTAYGA